MKLPLVSIANSRGIRLPKAILAQCRMEEEVEIEVQDQKIILSPAYRRSYDLKFENIAQMDDQEVIEMLKRTDVTTLAIALIDVDETTKNKVFRNMSQRACGLLGADIERFSRMEVRELVVAMHRSRVNTTFRELERSI